jgi:parallel beta-helix repeat protein
VSVNSEYGIWAFHSSENSIIDNLIEHSDNAIYFFECDNNDIKKNILKNSNIGISLESSDNNIIRLNRFPNTQEDVQEISSINNKIQLPSQIISIIWSVSGIVSLGVGSVVSVYLVKRSKKYKIKQLVERGEKLRVINKLNDAINRFDQILELDPENEVAINKKIAILYELKRYNEISEMLRNSSHDRQDL